MCTPTFTVVKVKLWTSVRNCSLNINFSFSFLYLLVVFKSWNQIGKYFLFVSFWISQSSQSSIYYINLLTTNLHSSAYTLRSEYTPPPPLPLFFLTSAFFNVIFKWACENKTKWLMFECSCWILKLKWEKHLLEVKKSKIQINIFNQTMIFFN